MWITGGNDYDGHDLVSTELITINGSTAGISLPFYVNMHCMVMYQPNAILLIGGYQDGGSESTWIIDPTKAFNMTEGPSLKVGRAFHSCGKMTDEYGNVLVIVADGDRETSV